METSLQTHSETVIAVFYEDDRVRGAVRNLEKLGFTGSQIDVTSEPEHPVAAETQEGNTLLVGVVSGALTGAIVGGVFGLLLGVGLLPRFSLTVLQDIAIGAAFAVIAGASVGGLLGFIAAWRMRGEPKMEPVRPGVLVSVLAGPRDEEAKSALIESGGDLNPTNAIEAMLL